MDPQHQQLAAIAYNILGSWQDSEDIVQEVLLERLRHENAAIENEKAYLVRAIINRSVSLKSRLQKNRSAYPGPWLPEPVETEGADYALSRKDILSYSLMILMEKLDARSRAVFILKEAFDYSHHDIAEALDISVQNSRQILNRARKQLGNLDACTPAGGKAIDLAQYIDLIHRGDTARLETLLHADIMTTSDGGGKAVAALHPLQGKDLVMPFIAGIYRKFYSGAEIIAGRANHQPAIYFFEQGQLVNCQIMELCDGVVSRIYFMRNPDKLSALQAALGKKANFVSLPEPDTVS